MKLLPVIHMLNAIRLELLAVNTPHVDPSREELIAQAEAEVQAAFSLARAGDTFTRDELEAAIPSEADATSLLNTLRMQRGESPIRPAIAPTGRQLEAVSLVDLDEDEDEDDSFFFEEDEV